MLKWLEDADRRVATWIWTRVEIISAIERRVRQGLMSDEQRRAALIRLADLAAEWDEVNDLPEVKRRAIRLLSRHPLRAADAGQLGAAVLVRDQRPPGPATFVSLDVRLALAAEREGFRLPEPVVG